LLVAQDWDELTGDEPDQEAVPNADFAVATSPAVGVYQPRRDLTAGMSIRAGDRVGFVDVLGVHQDVVAPVDGTIGSSLAEAGEAVEYGQELVQIEPPVIRAAGAAWTAGSGPAAAPAATPEAATASTSGQKPAGYEPAGRGPV